MPLIPEPFVGHAAGLATSFLWTGSSLLFAAASRRLGPTILNAARLCAAIILLTLTHRFLFGDWFPAPNARQLLFLAASGLVGLTIGDNAGFAAFNDIGPRLTALVFTTAPPIAALFGWTFLGERLASTAWLGMAITLAGVVWVVLERPPALADARRPAHRLRGILFALVASACQAAGLLLSKQGIGHGWLPEDQHLEPQAATLTRVVCAAIAMLPILAWHSRRRGAALQSESAAASQVQGNRPGNARSAGLAFAAAGAVFGPFLGVWMSLVASDRAPLGVAQTLCSLPPVFLIPAVVILHRERVTLRAALGAVLAVVGTAILFWK